MTDRVIKVIVDLGGATPALNRLEDKLGGVERNTKRTNSALRTLRRAAISLAAGLSVREIGQYADQFTNVNNRLRLVTDGTAELATVQREIIDLANRTRSPLEDTASLYQRSARAAGELGLSQRDLLGITESVNQATQISGSSTAEASGAVRQFTQAIAGGILRAEEFNSIIEGTPRLAQAIEEGLGLASGALRGQVIAGAVSASDVLRSLRDQAGELDEEFARIAPTIGAAFTVANNSATVFVGRLNEVTGASSALAQFIIDLSGDMLTLADAVTSNLGPTDELSNEMEGVAVVSVILIEALKSVLDVLLLIPRQIAVVGDLFGGLAASIVLAAKGDFAGAGRALGDALGNGVVGGTVENLGTVFDSLLENASDASRSITEIFDESFRAIRESADLSTGGGGAATGGPDAAAIAKQTEFLQGLRETRNELSLETALFGEADGAILRYRTALEAATLGGVDFVAQALELADAVNAQQLAVDNLAAAAEQRDFLDSLQQTQNELALQTALLGDSDSALLRYRTSLEAAKLGGPEFVESALAIADAINEQREALEARESQAERREFINALEDETEALALSSRERSIRLQLQRLGVDATDEEIAKVRELAGALFDEQQNIDAFGDFLRGAREGAQRTLSGFLADPIAEGLDELPLKFANVLQDLLAEALASEFFRLILGIPGGGSSGGTGGLLSGFLSGLGFGSPAADGRTATRPGEKLLVGERGPELFEAPTSGSIQPTGSFGASPAITFSPNIVNALDPAAAIEAIQTDTGKDAILNLIFANKDEFSAALGVR